MRMFRRTGSHTTLADHAGGLRPPSPTPFPVPACPAGRMGSAESLAEKMLRKHKVCGVVPFRYVEQASWWAYLGFVAWNICIFSWWIARAISAHDVVEIEPAGWSLVNNLYALKAWVSWVYTRRLRKRYRKIAQVLVVLSDDAVLE